jgi:hypothetical protein
VKRLVAAGLVLIGSLMLAVAAHALTVRGGAGADVMKGTTKADVIYGYAGNDTIYGRGGNDKIYPGPGRDKVYCGAGRDQVWADSADVVAADCEVVKRPASVPPTLPPPSPPIVFGTRSNPYPVGTDIDLADGWKMQVNSSTPDATAAVLAENMFNDPPVAGDQFFIANVTATYTGPDSKSFDGSFRLRAVGPSAVAYSTFEDACGVIPDEIPDSQVFTGGAISGNICWQIKSADIALVMFDHGFLSSTPDKFFALR